MEKRLTRVEEGKMLGGVCGASRAWAIAVFLWQILGFCCIYHCGFCIFLYNMGQDRETKGGICDDDCTRKG